MAAGQVNLEQGSRSPGSNDIMLQCLDVIDDAIPNAVFYRNGARFVDDPCFSGSMVGDGSTISITVSPPCEGYFMCGEDGGTVVSSPTSIYGERGEGEIAENLASVTVQYF